MRPNGVACIGPQRGAKQQVVIALVATVQATRAASPFACCTSLLGEEGGGLDAPTKENADKPAIMADPKLETPREAGWLREAANDATSPGRIVSVSPGCDPSCDAPPFTST